MKKALPQCSKKACWKEFSTMIRVRDCLRTTGCSSWGLCITCGKRYHIKLLQAGHFVPGRHTANLFYEQGVHAQCYNCNINLKGNTLEYRRQIIKLYGEGVDQEIEANDKKTIQYKKWQYYEMREYFKRRTKELGGMQCQNHLS